MENTIQVHVGKTPVPTVDRWRAAALKHKPPLKMAPWLRFLADREADLILGTENKSHVQDH